MTARERRDIFPRVASVLTITFGLLVGCGGGFQSSDSEPGTQAWTAQPSGVRIGSLDDPEYLFGAVAAAKEGPDGRLYSVHFQEGEVRRWTLDGSADGVVGRQGEGPGEFQMPGELGFFGDSVWVVDRRLNRVSYFTLAGEFLGQARLPINTGGGSQEADRRAPRANRPLRGGGFYGATLAFSQEIAEGNLTEVHHVTMNDDGEILSTMWTQPYETWDILALIDGDRGSFMQQPFGDGFVFGLNGDDQLVVLNRRIEGGPEHHFRLTWHTASGDTALTHTVPYDPTPLHPAQVDSSVDAQAERMFEFLSRMTPGMAIGQLRSDIAEATHVPPSWPAASGLLVAANGATWVQLAPPRTNGREWLVFDRQGVPVASVVLPDGFRLLDVTDTHVWGVEQDELDVSYIVRLDLVK